MAAKAVAAGVAAQGLGAGVAAKVSAQARPPGDLSLAWLQEEWARASLRTL